MVGLLYPVRFGDNMKRNEVDVMMNIAAVSKDKLKGIFDTGTLFLKSRTLPG